MRRSYPTIKDIENRSKSGWKDKRKLTIAPPDVCDAHITVRSIHSHGCCVLKYPATGNTQRQNSETRRLPVTINSKGSFVEARNWRICAFGVADK